MKQRVAEMEAEAAKLREMQAEAEAKEAQPASPGTPMDAEDDKTMSDSRSVYVGNVRRPRPFSGGDHLLTSGVLFAGRVRCDAGRHPGAFPGVRDYQPSDDSLRQVHWPSEGVRTPVAFSLFS